MKITVKHIRIAGFPAVQITQPGCYETIFVRYGWLPSRQQPNIHIVKGVAFTGYWEAALAALSDA